MAAELRKETSPIQWLLHNLAHDRFVGGANHQRNLSCTPSSLTHPAPEQYRLTSPYAISSVAEGLPPADDSEDVERLIVTSEVARDPTCYFLYIL